MAQYDEDFVWNRTLLTPLLDGVRAHLDQDQQNSLDNGGFFLPVIRGAVGAVQMPSSHPTIGTSMHLAVVSRVGCNRPGAGLRNRGLDDEGNVASFVEVRPSVSHSVSFFSLALSTAAVSILY